MGAAQKGLPNASGRRVKSRINAPSLVNKEDYKATMMLNMREKTEKELQKKV